jgi:hypothetical protein
LATNERSDRALNVENARILCGAYYGLLAVVFTLSLDAIILFLGYKQLIPLFAGTLLAMSIASVFGYVFGEKIIHTKFPYLKKVFFYGWIMTYSALPFYCVGLVWFYLSAHSEVMHSLNLLGFLKLYAETVGHAVLLVGSWLSLFSGLAALYLRSYLVYYVYDSSDE